MTIYSAFCRSPLRRTYLGKLVAAATAGMLLPAVAALAVLLLHGDAFPSTRLIAGILLGSTAAGIVLAAWLLRGLLEPLRRAEAVISEGAGDPRAEETVPDSADLAGRLLALSRRVGRGREPGTGTDPAAATIDPLTGLRNRQWCELNLASEIERIGMSGHGLGVALLDLDALGDINRRHGRPVGDECLCVLARTTRDAIRTGDRLARWEGSRFLLVMSGGRDDIGAALDRVRSAVSDSDIPLGDGNFVSCTVSVGIVTGEGVEPPDALVRSADRALADAKAAGRDRVRFYGD